MNAPHRTGIEFDAVSGTGKDGKTSVGAEAEAPYRVVIGTPPGDAGYMEPHVAAAFMDELAVAIRVSTERRKRGAR